MNDLISRQEAINEIEERINAHSLGGNVALISELNRLEGYILHLPSAQPEMKWIPVREELPRESGLYLVTTSKNNVYLWTYKPEMAEVWIHLISAWTYLPEPYYEV